MSLDRETPSGLERIIFFSDAVFAIAITLLVLELKVGPLTEGASESSVGHALLGLFPRWVGFAVSFFLIGAMWVEHHRIFQYLAGWDYGLAWRNLVLLSGVAMMPFPTALFSQYYWLRTPLVIYALNIAFVGAAKLWTWRHAVSAKLVAPQVAPGLVKVLSRRSWALPAASVATALAAMLGVPFAYFGFLATPLFAALLAASAKARAVPPARPAP